MNIKQYLKETLENKEILELLADKKVFFIHANNAKEPYLEYQIINEYGDEFCENEEKFTKYIIQIDVFSKKDYSKIEEVVKKHMENSNFSRDMSADLFEEKTNLCHKAMRFNISLQK